MSAPRHFRVADLGEELNETEQFCIAEIEWSKPELWRKDEVAPVSAANHNSALYVLVRDHWRQLRRGTIVYIGMTTNLQGRFGNHPKAREISQQHGDTLLSVGKVTYSGRHARWAGSSPTKALKQIEHILIWALWPTLTNEKSLASLPLLAGKNVADAKPWLIRRKGYRFAGRMPREIVYPWMIVKPGRDRSLRRQ